MENNRNIAAIGLVGMLHEMNNPLTTIQLCIELLESGISDPGRFYDMMKKSADSMEMSIRDICTSFAEENLVISGYNKYSVALEKYGRTLVKK